ncbi:MAG: glycosyltransferase family 4 protein [Gammaproteobacteria bacterium]
MKPDGTYLLTLPWDLEVVGGVNQVVISLYRQFEAHSKMRPLLLVGDWAAKQPVEQKHPSGIDTVRLAVRPPFETRHFGFLPYELVRFLPSMRGELRKIAELTRRYDVRVVNCHFIGSDTLTWALAKATGAYRGKLFLSLHGFDIRWLARMTGLRRALWRRALESVDVIVACSQGLADETIAAFDLSGRNVVTIHNGVQAEKLRQLAEGALTPGAARAGRELVNLGTFEHKKGHDLLLRAFAKLAPQFPDVHLSILGRPAETLESTQALMKELKLEDRVTLRVNVPHAEALATLRNAELFVLPSRNEAFSVALLEAGAIGKPVVAASVCGVPELIDDRSTGILVPPEDVEALSDGIAYMLKNPQTAQQFGTALRKRVLEKFTAEATFQNYLALTQ